MTDADPADGGFAASATAADLDMSGVDPLRYAEMRRRIAVIREFVATERPPKAVRETFAARLGVGEKQFMRLVSTWRALGDQARAAHLDGATGGKGGQRERRGGLSAEARAVVAEVITDIGSDASLAATLAEVRRLAAERAMRPPGRSSIWNLLMEARSQGAPSRQEPGIVTGVVFAKLPVVAGVKTVYPEIVLAVRSPDGAILEYEVTTGAEDAGVTSVLLRRSPCVRDGDIVVEDEDGQRLGALLGRRIAGIGIIHHPSLASPAAALVRSRRDSPISPRDARRLIALAVEEHNLARANASADSDVIDHSEDRVQRPP